MMPSTTNSNNPLSYELSDNDIEFLLKQAQAGVVAAEDLADVSDASGVRTLDGFGNNVENPLWGNADQTFKRLSDTHFDNGVDTPREGPVPRDISNLILNQNKDGETNNFGPNAGDDDLNLENNFRANEFVWAFGQYFDHGLDFIPKGGENGDGTEAGTMFLGNFETQNGDIPLTLTRATPADGTGINGVPREYINQTSPFIDQNQAYGSNDKILEFLLERDDNGQFTGRLLSGANTDIPTLGEAKANWQKGVDNGLAEAIDFDDPDALSNFRGSGDALLLDINPGIPLDLHLVAGDGRVNENAGLSVVHTIWHNNHNFWVEKLAKHYDENGGGENVTNEHLYQMAKIINEAEYQRAVADEFIELLVGSDVHAFLDYNPEINADITLEFSQAAYRLGHSMLNNHITVRTDADGSTEDVPLFDLFLNPIQFTQLGADNIASGMFTSLQQEIDAQIVTTVRDNLLGRPLDLGSLNIGRGRDTGLPTLNDMRESVGLSKYSDWDSFANNLRDPSQIDDFKAAYNSIDEVDLWVGGLAEKPSASDAFGTELAQNSVMGETFAQVFSTQMIALQDGDRFYYKHRLLETELLANIQNQDFADIIERTLDLEYLSADVFKVMDARLDFRDHDVNELTLEGTDGHDIIIGREISETINGKNGDDTIFAEGGDDEVFGGDGDDAMHGGTGDDRLIGEDGDDRADGGFGEDHIEGGIGDDDLSGNEGDDYVDGGLNDDEAFGGAGNDHVRGGSGHDELWGGLGDDLVDAGVGNDIVNGSDGNDTVLGGHGNDRLMGGEGDDTLTGGQGRDEYWFLPESGQDVITDFEIGKDKVDLHRYVWEFGKNEVLIALNDISDNDDHALLTLPEGSTIKFEGVSKSDLLDDARHFILEDRVFERENLILDDETSIVVDAGKSKDDARDLQIEYFQLAGRTESLEEIDFNADPIHVENTDQVKFNAKGGSFYKDGPKDYFAARMTSNFEATEAGEYTFYLTSDDGSKLIIDEEPVIDNDGLHSSKRETVTVELEEGMHELELLYFENTGNASVDLDWSGPGFGKKQMKFEAAEEPEEPHRGPVEKPEGVGEEIEGTNGKDYLVGTDGNDTINAKGGKDVVVGSRGDDEIDGGGAEYDQVDYSGAASDYTFTANSDGSVTVSHPTNGTDTLKDIDGFWFTGEGKWYPIEDLVDQVPTDIDGEEIEGTNGKDYLFGTAGNDTIDAKGGKDVVVGSLGNDDIDGGGSEYDQVDYSGAASDYTFTVNDDGSVTVSHPVNGTDTLKNIDGFWFTGEGKWYPLEDLIADQPGGGQGETIEGTDDDDYLVGTSGDDDIDGKEGRDVIKGSKGDDNIDGGGSEYDQVDYSGAADDYTFTANDDGSVTAAHSTNGTDTLKNIDGFWFSGEGKWYAIDDVVDLVPTDIEGEEINGTNKADYLSGTAGNDEIDGRGGRDVIKNSLGNDVIDGGGSEYDQVDYKGGKDDYVFEAQNNGSITVSNDVYGVDTLIDIDGVWFEGDAEWHDIDELV